MRRVNDDTDRLYFVLLLVAHLTLNKQACRKIIPGAFDNRFGMWTFGNSPASTSIDDIV